MRNLIPAILIVAGALALTLAIFLAASLASAPRSEDIENLPCYIAQPIQGTNAIGIFPVECQFDQESE